MGEVPSTPEMLFTLVLSPAGNGLPRIGEDPARDDSAVAEQLGAKGDTPTAFAIGTGEQILAKLDEVVGQLTRRTM